MIEIGLQELEAKIRKDCKDDLEKINSQMEEEIKAIKEGIKKKARVQADQVKKEGEAEIVLVRKRIMADANTQVRAIISSEKNKLLDKVFQEAGDIIRNLSDSEKKHILRNLADEGMRSIDDPVILVDKKYVGLLDGAKPADLGDFGVVVISKDKTLRIDNTLESRLKQFKATIKPEVVSILFGENDSTVSGR